LALYFLDTSALVKLYVREPGTDEMLRLASQAGQSQMAIISVASVELRAAVRRRERMEDLGHEKASALLDLFDEHVRDSVFLRQPLTEAAIETALRLIDDHALRAYDALQLAACLIISGERPVFCCSDKALLDAAGSEGLAVFDPVNP